MILVRVLAERIVLFPFVTQHEKTGLCVENIPNHIIAPISPSA